MKWIEKFYRALHNLDYRDGVKGLSPLVADATFNFDLTQNRGLL